LDIAVSSRDSALGNLGAVRRLSNHDCFASDHFGLRLRFAGREGWLVDLRARSGSGTRKP
jgi:hypothetical protein